MTIEKAEFGPLGLLFNRPKKVEVVPPGTTELLDSIPMRTISAHARVGRTITVISPDEVEVTYRGVYAKLPRTYVKEEINQAKIVGVGAFSPVRVFFPRKTVYTWRP